MKTRRVYAALAAAILALVLTFGFAVAPAAASGTTVVYHDFGYANPAYVDLYGDNWMSSTVTVSFQNVCTGQVWSHAQGASFDPWHHTVTRSFFDAQNDWCVHAYAVALDYWPNGGMVYITGMRP
jgi:hypothetical protein